MQIYRIAIVFCIPIHRHYHFSHRIYIVLFSGIVILVQWSGAGGQRDSQLQQLSRVAEELGVRAEALEIALGHLPDADAAAHGLPACGSCDCSPPPMLVVREPAPPCDCGSGAQKPSEEPEEPLRPSDPQLCVVVKTDSKTAHSHLRSMIHSLLVHRPSNVRFFLMDPDPKDHDVALPYLQRLALELNHDYNFSAIQISSLTQANATAAWPNTTADHGYLLVDTQLEVLLNATEERTKKYICDYVMFSAATNLYLARFVPLFTRAMRNETGLVGCDFISPFFITEGLGYKPGHDISRYGRNQQYFASFSVGHMDLGAMIIQSKALRQTGIRFCIDRLRSQQATGCEFVADGLISQRLIAAGISNRIIPEVLFVKQQSG